MPKYKFQVICRLLKQVVILRVSISAVLTLLALLKARRANSFLWAKFPKSKPQRRKGWTNFERTKSNGSRSSLKCNSSDLDTGGRPIFESKKLHFKNSKNQKVGFRSHPTHSRAVIQQIRAKIWRYLCRNKPETCACRCRASFWCGVIHQ